MSSVVVNISNTARYDVIVERDALTALGPRLAAQFQTRKAAIVTDPKVAARWLKPLSTSLESSGITPIVATFPGGEQHKTLDSVASVVDQLLPHRLDRKTPLLALGGGIVGDVGGFVAGTLLRGVPLVQVPTTLLAMVDASVGGKTGVNHATGKNLIGVFHQPQLVLIDPQTLTTLPKSELIGGLAECFKHEIIRDAEGFDALERNIGRALALDLDYLTDLIAHNVAIKARVVEADPTERGERAHLNFGHTFAHAIEKATDHRVAHGPAVALGITAASRLAVALGLLPEQDASRIVALLGRAGLPTHLEALDADAVVTAMFFDKKVEGGKLRLILPERIGSVTIRDDVPIERVRAAVESIAASGSLSAVRGGEG